MHDGDLSFYTTQELINELMHRKTFLGVVVRSEKEFTSDEWGPERIFKVHFNDNISSAQAGRLLKKIADYVDAHDDC